MAFNKISVCKHKRNISFWLPTAAAAIVVGCNKISIFFLRENPKKKMKAAAARMTTVPETDFFSLSSWKTSFFSGKYSRAVKCGRRVAPPWGGSGQDPKWTPVETLCLRPVALVFGETIVCVSCSSKTIIKHDDPFSPLAATFF